MKLTPFLEYILYDVFDEKDNITTRAMMGGNILYSDGKVFAIAEEDELWFKGSDQLAAWYLSRGSKKFSYMKPARPACADMAGGEGKPQGMNYFLVPQEVIEDRERLDEWMDVALTVAKVPKGKKKS